METDQRSMGLISAKKTEEDVWDWEVGDRVTRSRRLEGVKMISVRNNRIIVAEKRQKKWQRESKDQFQFLP